MRDYMKRAARIVRFAAVATGAAMLMSAPALAARGGFPEATRAYDAGDHGAAAAIWHDLAADCDAGSRMALAGLYHAGLGVPQNDVEALRWYLMAAWAGNRYAQQVAGDWYASGDIVPVDRVRAAFWLTLAAGQGLAGAAGRRDAALATLDRSERDALAGRLDAYSSIAAGMCARIR